MENESENLTKYERREMRREEKNQERDAVRRKKTVRRIALWTLTALVLAGTVFGIAKYGARTPAGVASQVASSASSADWTHGPADAKVTLIEYSDFQCPACGAYYPILKQLNQEFGDKILFAYRHFPLTKIHPNAEPAAWAAEAAGLQGKFWEMHDMIFENQNSWSGTTKPKDIFVSYARKLGLDESKFTADYGSDEVRSRVDQDYQGGIDSFVNSTPTFFLNGKKMTNPSSYEEFKNVIQQTIGSNP